jgi:hypothetical protein
MKKILLALAGGALIGVFAASHAQTAKPAPAAPKGPSAMDMAMDRAVANYRKNKGMSMEAKKPAAAMGMGMGAKDAAKKK